MHSNRRSLLRGMFQGSAAMVVPAAAGLFPGWQWHGAGRRKAHSHPFRHLLLGLWPDQGPVPAQDHRPESRRHAAAGDRSSPTRPSSTTSPAIALCRSQGQYPALERQRRHLHRHRPVQRHPVRRRDHRPDHRQGDRQGQPFPLHRDRLLGQQARKLFRSLGGANSNPPEATPQELYTRLFGPGFQDGKGDWKPDPEVMLQQSVLSVGGRRPQAPDGGGRRLDKARGWNNISPRCAKSRTPWRWS